MTSLDPSHIPTTRHDTSRGHAIIKKGHLRIPDLRFEQSYLSSLQRGIHFEDFRTASLFVDDANGNGRRRDVQRKAELYGVPLSVEWRHVLYVTFRDQLLSPFLQGAALAMATWYLRPFLRTLGARIRTHISSTWLSIFTSRSLQSLQGEEKRSWMKSQVVDMGTHGVSTNIALAR